VRIAQVAPLIERVPPLLYGGTERIVCYLTEELVRQGHDVTLFASADSVTSARLVPCSGQPLRFDDSVRDAIPYYMRLIDRVRAHADEFDVLHFHIDQFHFPLFRLDASRTVTTLHGRQDSPDLQVLYRTFPEMPLVSISDSQRGPISFANFLATVPHGLPTDLLEFETAPRGGYLAFLGRISPEKQPDVAIAIARACGMPLKIAAKVDGADQDYFEQRVRPLLSEPGIEYIGEVGEKDKSAFLGNAAAMLFPIDWPEPFGLVLIEAMACGTPIVAFRRGSVPEVVEDGLTGVVVNDAAEAIEALPRALALPRDAIRRRFEERFTAGRMASDYVRVYERLLAEGRARHRAVGERSRTPVPQVL
jgi:glycosyltransferase involved in cell wall biosynthesis